MPVTRSVADWRWRHQGLLSLRAGLPNLELMPIRYNGRILGTICTNL